MVHFFRIVAIVALAVLVIVYPFLPGKHDSLAVALSTMTQAFAGLAVVFVVPIGLLWLVYELRGQARRKRGQAAGRGEFYFAVAAVVTTSLVAVMVSLVALAMVGYALWLLALALWLYIVARLVPRLKRMRSSPGEGFNAAPLYLVLIPVAVLASQLALAGPMTEFSRSRAIANAAVLIEDIEQCQARDGQYPRTMAATWKDYEPLVVGVEKYHYAPNGDAYDLFFQQPRFLFDQLGTHEFVVYNKRDEHVILSHASWYLLLTPEVWRVNQGWYSSHDAQVPHWKYFWFD